MLKYNLEQFQRDTAKLLTLEQTLTQTSATSLPGIGLLISNVLRQTEALSTEVSRKLN
jgi:hypothetical protein